jgi:hypothetical protein
MCVSGASVSGVCYDDSKSWQSFVPSVGGLRVTSVEVPVSKLETTFPVARCWCRVDDCRGRRQGDLLGRTVCFLKKV